jgi:hypothetical protein
MGTTMSGGGQLQNFNMKANHLDLFLFCPLTDTAYSSFSPIIHGLMFFFLRQMMKPFLFQFVSLNS